MPKASHRYTPKQSKKKGPSPVIVPIMMFVCFGLGFLVILLNYFNGTPLLPGNDPSNANLLGGLGLITAGFVIATQYR